jgi:hypothetical protein
MIIMGVFHKLYCYAGCIFCNIIRLFSVCSFKASETDSVLFVAHPDDDTLFFHTLIKHEKPYVVLMTTGWSIKRLICFIKVMKSYGVRFRVYSTNEDDLNLEEKLTKQVKSVCKRGKFNKCYTHNAAGEYGHPTHQLVHKCVTENVDCDIYVPASKEKIGLFLLDNETIDEKIKIFKNFYITETFVIDEYKEWLEHEHLERFISDE